MSLKAELARLKREMAELPPDAAGKVTWSNIDWADRLINGRRVTPADENNTQFVKLWFAAHKRAGLVAPAIMPYDAVEQLLAVLRLTPTNE